MSQLLVRAHSSMTVLQLKMELKRRAVEVEQERQASQDDGGAGGGLSVPHASLLSLHADSMGALSDFVTLEEYAIDIGGGDEPSTLHAFIHAPHPDEEQRAQTPPDDMAFDASAADAEEGWFDLRCVFANAPATAARDARAEAETGLEAEESETGRTAHEEAGHTDHDEPSHLSSRPSSRRSGRSSSPSSHRSHSDSDNDSSPIHSGRASGSPSHGAVASDAAFPAAAAASPSSAAASATGGHPSHRPTSRSRGSGAASHGPSTARTSGMAPSEGAGDTGRKFLEDDGDIASQSSAGDEWRARETAMQHQQHALRMQQQQEMEEQQAAQAQAQQTNDAAQLRHSSSQAQIQLAASLAAAAGLVKGDLLDGYRLLRACGVDLPEEVSRATLSGCNPPLVDAVPEHLAEFTNLAYLDLSGNNLPMDRLRLLPLLDDLNLSCNRIRDVDFSPLLGTHYSSSEDPEAVRSRVWPLEDMVGFPALRNLDLSFNFLSSDAVHVLSVLPRLESLSLASNGLRHLPRESLSNFWRLTKLSLRDNELGSGSGLRKEQVSSTAPTTGALGRTLVGGLKKGGLGVSPMPPQRHQRQGLDPLHAAGMARDDDEDEGDEDEDEDEAAICPRSLRKEFRLLRALSTLPSLVELDLSENCLTAIPAGSIPPGPASFPKLQFLNLACNELRSERAVLPLGDMMHLQWLDLRGNPFLSSNAGSAATASASGAASSSSTRPPRNDRHAQLHGRRINWATRFPDLYHVLVENCRVNVVLARPRHGAQSMQQDLSHLLRPLGPAGADQAFSGRLGTDIESEAAAARSRVSSAKQRAFAQGSLHRPPGGSAPGLSASSSAAGLATGPGSSGSLREEKEAGALHQQQQFGFSTAHEWEGEGEASQRPPPDALQLFLAQQQQQLLSQQQQQQQQHPHSSRAGAPGASASSVDPFSEQYAAYSDTFLTGMNAEELQHTAAFASSTGGGAAPSPSPARPHATGSVVYPPAQLLARRATQHATHALGALLNQSGLSVLQASRPNKRLEAHKISAPPTVLPKPSASSRSGAGSGGVSGIGGGGGHDSLNGRRRDFSTNQARVSMFGVRQPKVAKVYSRMEAVLASIESSFAPHASSTIGGPTMTLPLPLSSMAPGLGSGRKPNVRGATSSAYVDPTHARTTDKLRALRHLDKERADVAQLLRTVAEVSSVALNAPSPSLAL